MKTTEPCKFCGGTGCHCNDLPAHTPFNPLSRNYVLGDGRQHIARLMDKAAEVAIDLAAEGVTTTITIVPADSNSVQHNTVAISGSTDITLYQNNQEDEPGELNEVWLDSDTLAIIRRLLLDTKANGEGAEK